MIESVKNESVKFVKKLQANRQARTAAGLFVVEGSRWVHDVLSMGIAPHTLFCTQAYVQGAGVSAETLPAYTLVTPAVMKAMSDVGSPPGILAIVPMLQPQLEAKQADWLLILDQVRTPGNLGTLLRTAAAAGVAGVILTKGCVDAYNPKVVRGSMGAHLRIPILSMTWDDIGTTFAHFNFYVARADGENTYTAVDWRQPSALIIGSEAQGASAAARQLARGLTIPMASQTESLNAATAGAIILFEANRQRNLKL